MAPFDDFADVPMDEGYGFSQVLGPIAHVGAESEIDVDVLL
jgi:hypothetical protein